MPLSEYEQRVLEQMERQLSSDDPRLASTFQGGGAPGGMRRWLLVGAGVVVGLVLLLVGASTGQAWVGVIGFIVMFAAVAFAFTPRRASGPVGLVDADGGVRPAGDRRRPGATAASSRRAGFMARLEERWERRRQGR